MELQRKAKAKKAAMLATIESRTIRISEVPKKLNDSRLYRTIRESEDYKNKVSNKQDVIFVILKKSEIPHCPVIENKIIQQKNIWFVIVDDDVEDIDNISREMIIEKSKLVR